MRAKVRLEFFDRIEANDRQFFEKVCEIDLEGIVAQSLVTLSPSNEKARSEERTLLTDDKDYGELVFRRKLPSASVVLLRLHRLPQPERLQWLESRWSRIRYCQLDPFGTNLGWPESEFEIF